MKMGNVLEQVEGDRQRVMSVFREAISKNVAPEDIALQALVDAMHPQSGKVLNSEENSLLENGLRSLLEECAAQAVAQKAPVMTPGQGGALTRLLDIVLHLCELGATEAGMVFTLLEDLTEISTIQDCKEVFGYIESKQEVLGKAHDVVFCGRILMFLAHFFPISERSAANVKGSFNVLNKTQYLHESEPPPGAFPPSSNLTMEVYKTFWGLQEYLSNPPQLLLPHKWEQFKADLGAVADVFEKQAVGGEEGGGVRGDETFSTKFLTSPNLLTLELGDSSFRRHVLTQTLIIFHYLKAPGKADKDDKKEALRLEVEALERRVRGLLGSVPPRAAQFAARVDAVLDSERNWVAWKKEGCRPFDKAAENLEPVQEPEKKRPRWYMGNKDLDRIFKAAAKAPDFDSDSRTAVPTLTDYFQRLADDMDPASEVEAEYHHREDKVFGWRGLRLAAKEDYEAFIRFNEHGIEGVVPKELLTEAVRLQMYPPTAIPKRIPPKARSGDGKAGGGAEKEVGVKVERGSEQPTGSNTADVDMTPAAIDLTSSDPAEATPMDTNDDVKVNAIRVGEVEVGGGGGEVDGANGGKKGGKLGEGGIEEKKSQRSETDPKVLYKLEPSAEPLDLNFPPAPGFGDEEGERKVEGEIIREPGDTMEVDNGEKLQAPAEQRMTPSVGLVKDLDSSKSIAGSGR